MKKILTLIATVTVLTSCGNGTKDCISKLQFEDNIVYSIDAFNYIVIKDSTVYHYIAQSRWCGDSKYIKIKIK